MNWNMIMCTRIWHVIWIFHLFPYSWRAVGLCTREVYVLTCRRLEVSSPNTVIFTLYWVLQSLFFFWNETRLETLTAVLFTETLHNEGHLVGEKYTHAIVFLFAFCICWGTLLRLLCDTFNFSMVEETFEINN